MLKGFSDSKLVSDGAEYECPTDEKFQQTNGKLCMSLSLACDGLPNCGDNTIPNPDEACFKVRELIIFQGEGGHYLRKKATSKLFYLV